MKRFVAFTLPAFAFYFLLGSPSRVDAGGAGRITGLDCYLAADSGNFYIGSGMIVQSSSGVVSGHCNLNLDGGTPVTSAVSGTYSFYTPYGAVTAVAVETPSGQANVQFGN
jgi:hypothetical protein